MQWQSTFDGLQSIPNTLTDDWEVTSIRRATHKRTRAWLSGQLYGQKGRAFRAKTWARRLGAPQEIAAFCGCLSISRAISSASMNEQRGGGDPRNRKCGDSAEIDGRARQCLPRWAGSSNLLSEEMQGRCQTTMVVEMTDSPRHSTHYRLQVLKKFYKKKIKK